MAVKFHYDFLISHNSAAVVLTATIAIYFTGIFQHSVVNLCPLCTAIGRLEDFRKDFRLEDDCQNRSTATKS